MLTNIKIGYIMNIEEYVNNNIMNEILHTLPY